MAKTPQRTDGVVIRDLEEANRVLQELDVLQSAVEDISNTLQRRINIIKGHANKNTEPLARRMKDLEKGLVEFAKKNKALFKGKKSVDLAFGRFGWRSSVEVKPKSKWTWKQVLGRLLEEKMTHAVRIQEAVDKDALHKMADWQLDCIGARRVPKETFWYELNREELEKTAAAAAG